MRNLKPTYSIIYSLVGTAMIALAIVLAIFYTIPQEVMPALPVVMGAIGLLQVFTGINSAVIIRMKNKNAKLEKELSGFEDERADVIELKSKAKTNNFTNYLLLALLLFLAAMDVQLIIILGFVGAMLLRIIVLFYYMRKFNKEM